MSGGAALMDAYEQVKERKAYFPDDYRGVATYVGTAAQSIQPESYFYSGHFNTAPMMEFRSAQKHYAISKPILIRVHKVEDVFFAENESLVLSGAGQSREDALLDFISHLDYFYNFYKNKNERELAGDALRLKQIYDTLLVEV